MKYPWFVAGSVAVILSSVALWRGEFSVEAISAPLGQEIVSAGVGMGDVFAQPFSFLGKGRQTFAFESQDGLFVIKFFNRKYLEMPWYAFALRDVAKERHKREMRTSFYQHSYSLAEECLKEQTCIIYVHDHATSGLPLISVKDQTGKISQIDLNTVPFVLQRKGQLFCERLRQVSLSEGERLLEGFLQLVASRIAKGIADADHDVEHNFGCVGDRVFHLDPGRLFVDDLSGGERRAYEWWSATHNLRKWLVENLPELVPVFDEHLVKVQTL